MFASCRAGSYYWCWFTIVSSCCLHVGTNESPYLVTFILLKDIFIWKAPPCGVYGSRVSLLILRAGGLYTQAGFSVPAFRGGFGDDRLSVVPRGNPAGK